MPELKVRLEVLMPLIREKLEQGQSVRFSPQGLSMLPMLRQNIDSVVLSPVPQKLRKYDLPLYQRDNGKFILHRILAVGETYTCCGDNQFEMEHGIRSDQIIAVVTEFYRGGNRHSVREPGYRIYCVVWHYTRPMRRFCRRARGWLSRHLRAVLRG